MNQTIKRTLFFLLATVTLLAACAPAPVPPTQDPAVVQEQIEQAVEATIAAQNAEATEQQALIVPSNTPLPTQTEPVPDTPTPSLPTATPFVIVPPTNTVAVSSGGGGSNPPIQPDYACSVVSRSPADNTVFRRNATFDIRWTIVNSGKKTIRAGADLKYFSGEEMATIRFVELPALAPGERYSVVLDAVAPASAGRYVMTWTVEGQLCFPYVAITVER